MIVIIKHGTVDEYEKTCPKCGCIFRFTDDDISKFDISRFDGAETIQVIDCPDCGEPILVKE